MKYQRTDSLFYQRPENISIEDCHFYHTMEVPGHGVMRGDWDIRESVSEYLGNLDYSGKRVLEIGPASGFLTFTMEKLGADVVCVEVEDDPGWDFVPFPDAMMAPIFEGRSNIMRRLKNSFWFSHKAHDSRSKVYYGDIYNLPDDLGSFDIAIMSSVLLHCRDPLRAVAQCAKRANTIVVTDQFFPELEGSAVCRLVPTIDNKHWDTWWNFSTTLFRQYFGVLGFSADTALIHKHTYLETLSVDLFTIIGNTPDQFSSAKPCPLPAS